MPSSVIQEAFQQHPWLVPVVYVGGSLLLGLFLEHIVLGRFRAFAKRTSWEADDVIANALSGALILWLLLFGIWSASSSLEMTPRMENLVRNVLVVVFILSVTMVLSKMTDGMISLYSGKSEGLIGSTSIFRNLGRAIVWIVGFLVVLQTLGISIAPILTALGVGGLAVALALQDTLSNLFAGLHIIASRQVRVGDFIRFEDKEGYVQDIRWRNTIIRALSNNMIIVPNAKLAGATIINYYQPAVDLSVVVELGVSYASDLATVERVTTEVARETMREVKGGVPDFEPFIRYHTFADSSINFSVILRGKEYTDKYLIQHEFMKRLQRRYQQEGIEIPFPQRTIHLREKVSES
jgi:small-conductance mechanosensitive channel